MRLYLEKVMVLELEFKPGHPDKRPIAVFSELQLRLFTPVITDLKHEFDFGWCVMTFLGKDIRS